MRPVEGLLTPGRPLVIVPEGPVVALPFQLLLTGPGSPYVYEDLPYLVRRHPISLELAAALLLETPPPPTAPTPLLAFGRSRFASTAEPGPPPPLDDLKHVREELERLRRHVPGATVALDEAATEHAFLEEAGTARLIHLASHALLDPAYPLNSFIVLSDDPEEDDDGLLYLYELQQHALPAELVVLSGCGTARGARRMGEGMIGLQYAVRSAGAASTLATLWPVDDRAMAELMDRFYAHLGDGLPKDRALQQAQLAYLDQHEGLASSPFFWAAAVLYGDAAPVEIGGAPSARVWIPVGLVLVLFGLLLPRLLRRRTVHD